jgi:hypothetical protein
MAPRLQWGKGMRLTVAALVALLAAPLSAATRLTYTIGDKAVSVEWPANAFPIRYQLDRRAASALTPEIVDHAFGLWAAVPDTAIRFQSEGVVENATAGYDGKNTISLVDELLRDQRAIAITTNWHDSKGHLTEADIQIDAALAAKGNYNIQQALTHEIGHFLGLDHSAVLSAAMFPYVARGTEAPRLDSDERVAIAAIYPAPRDDVLGAILKGRVVGNGGAVFAAQVVAVNELGEPVATGLTSTTGEFELKGVPAGAYRLYAEPLDGPVDTRNLTGVWRDASATQFATEFLHGETTVRNGQVIGNLILDTGGAPPTLNPKWIGVNASGGDVFALSTSAAAVKAGSTVALAIAGDGIFAGTTFDILKPGIRRVSDFRYAGNYVWATFEIGAETSGSAVIMIRNGNQTAALTGALRIEVNGNGGRTRAVRR